MALYVFFFVGARCTGLCQELNRCWVFPRSTVSHGYKEYTVECFRHFVIHAPINWACSEGKRGGDVQLKIRMVFLMFCTLRVYCVCACMRVRACSLQGTHIPCSPLTHKSYLNSYLLPGIGYSTSHTHIHYPRMLCLPRICCSGNAAQYYCHWILVGHWEVR